jgi:glutamine amidotransferase
VTRIGIFDYGAGNLHSLVKAISVKGTELLIEDDIRAAMRADILVFPGVGAFGAAANAMRGAQEDVRSALAEGHPCLGICLGMQMLFDASEESPGDGIGFIPGKVARLRTAKVPHMGWNDVEWTASQKRNGNPQIGTAYFANAFVCEPEEQSSVLAWTNHEDTRFASVVRRANTVGVQFHPEKSSVAGCAFVNAVIEDLIQCR